MIPWATSARSHFVKFAYKTNRICICQALLPSHAPPVTHFVEFVYELTIRGRIGKRRIRIEIRLTKFRLYEIQFVIRNFVLPKIRIRIQRVSLNSYTNFAIRLYEFRLQTNSYTKFRLMEDEMGPRRISYTKFRIRIDTWGRNLVEFVYEISSHFQFAGEIS